MKSFLMVYDRIVGEIVSLTEFAEGERAAALNARFELEQQRGANGNLEVVVLSARSVDDLKKTHSRYFFGSPDKVPEQV